MKKVLYILLLFVELLLDLIILSLLWNSTLYIAIAAIAVIWVGLLVWLLIKLKKADDALTKKKLYRRLILDMAAPIFIFVILVIYFIIGISIVT